MADGVEVSRILSEAGVTSARPHWGLAYNLALASIDPQFGVRAGLTEYFPEAAAVIRRDYEWREGKFTRKKDD